MTHHNPLTLIFQALSGENNLSRSRSGKAGEIGEGGHEAADMGFGQDDGKDDDEEKMPHAAGFKYISGAPAFEAQRPYFPIFSVKRDGAGLKKICGRQ
jgi:hypothetical protein